MRKLFSLGSTFLVSEKLRLNSVSNEQSRMEGKRFDSAFSWEVRVLLSFRSCKLQILTTFYYWEVRSLSLQLIIKDNLMSPS